MHLAAESSRPPPSCRFLPGLSRHLLGEGLNLPSVATWWCGQDYALDWVRDHLESVVVKPAFPSRHMEPIFGAELAKAEKQEFVEKLRSRPYDYVAQEQVALSAAPVWDAGSLFSRSMVLRTYVLNTGNGWIAMPGGLVRVAGSENRLFRCREAAIARMPGSCGMARWIPSACCRRATSRGTAAPIHRPAQPRGRRSFLVGPLCGALRKQSAHIKDA